MAVQIKFNIAMHYEGKIMKSTETEIPLSKLEAKFEYRKMQTNRHRQDKWKQ